MARGPVGPLQEKDIWEMVDYSDDLIGEASDSPLGQMAPGYMTGLFLVLCTKTILLIWPGAIEAFIFWEGLVNQ